MSSAKKMHSAAKQRQPVNTEVLSNWLHNVVAINNLICVMIYNLKHRAQHLLVWNNALPHIRKPPRNRRLFPTERIMNDGVFQRAKEEILLLNILKNRRHSWIGHRIRLNDFVVNILEGAIFRRKAVGRPRLQYLKQVARNTGADSYTAVKRMACNKSRWKAANQSKDWEMRKSSGYNVCRPWWWRRLTAGFRKNIELWLLVINFLIYCSDTAFLHCSTLMVSRVDFRPNRYWSIDGPICGHGWALNASMDKSSYEAWIKVWSNQWFESVLCTVRGRQV